MSAGRTEIGRLALPAMATRTGPSNDEHVDAVRLVLFGLATGENHDSIMDHAQRRRREIPSARFIDARSGTPSPQGPIYLGSSFLVLGPPLSQFEHDAVSSDGEN
jgi:hypothetical protein